MVLINVSKYPRLTADKQKGWAQRAKHVYMTSKLWQYFVYSALLSILLLSLGQAGYAQQIILPANVTVAPGQSAPFPVSLATPAPADGVFITLTSSDPSSVTVAPTNIFIPQGATSISRAATVSGVNAGSAIITASASGFPLASVQVTSGTSAGTTTMSFSPASLTITGTATQNFTLILSAPAPAGGLTINLSSSNAGVAKAPPTVNFGANTTSVAVPVTGVAAGSATITASVTGISSATAGVTITSSAAILLPASTTVALGQSVALAMLLPAPAPAGGVTVTLNSSDTSKVTVTPSVFIAAGALSPATPAQVNGINTGSATITASASGYAPGSGQVQVVAGAGSSFFSPASLTINAGSAGNFTLNLSGAAPAGLTASLSSSNTGVVTVTPTVTFAAGATSANVPVTGLAQGSATITASTPNFGNATANTTVSGASSSGIILPANVTVAPGQSAPFPVTLATAAPSGGVFIALTSSDTSKVAVAPDNIFIPQGAMAPGRAPTVSGISAGSATITASASGFPPASVQVTSGTASGATLSFSPGSLAINAGSTQNLTLNLSGPAPAGGLIVNLSSSDPGKATTLATVSFAANAISVAVPVTGVAAGSATITASATGVSNATAGVTVTATGAIALPANTTVGLGQSATLAVTLPAPAPAGGVTVTLNSSDTSKVTVTPSVFIAGGTASPATQPQVTGISLGMVTITASASGYTPGSGQVQAVASGGSSFFSPGSLAINAGSVQNFTLNLSAGATAGLTASLSSSNTGVATVPAAVTFGAGATSVTVPVTGVTAGSATITASTPNFGNANGNATVSASSSGIILPAVMTVAPGQSVSLPLTLSTAAPAGGVFITLLSSDPSTVAVAPSNIFIPQGVTTPNRAPVVNGINLGWANVIASASGFTPASGQVQVTPGGTIGAINLPANTTVGLGQAVMLPVTLPAPAPAGGVTVLLASSDTSKATVTPSVFIAGGTTSPATPTQVNGINLGLAVISASATGYAPGSGQVQVLAGGGSSFFSPASLTIGAGSSQTFTLNLSGVAPSGGLTASLSSSNTGVATVPPTVTFAAGASSANVVVTGLLPGSATITAITPSFGTANASVTVTSPTISVTWYGGCWQPATLNGVTGNFQAVDYDMTTAVPVTIQGSLFFAANCDPSAGIDNMNDFGTLTGSGHRVIGFSYHPDVIPTSALYWMGPRTADGMCAPGSPCSGCVNYNKSTPFCGNLP
jgi:trimeric autotransporter adhesin